jgi:uncharacterized protein
VRDLHLEFGEILKEMAMKSINIKNISKINKEKMKSVGMNFDESKVCGSLFIQNKKPIYNFKNNDKLEILDIKTALKQYKWAKKYYWNIIDPQKDEYTKKVSRDLHQGYFIRSFENQKVSVPVQACLYIALNGFTQNIHNIIIAEKNSELNINTGCLTASYVNEATHIGITEIYVKEGAKVTFTMIHNWGREVIVRPRTATLVSKNGKFISNYVCIKPVKDLQMAPNCTLKGEKSVGIYNSYLYGYDNSNIDLGTNIFLKGKNARSEISARVVCDSGKILVKAYNSGEAAGIKSHLECRGIILSKRGNIRAIPELDAHLPDLEMTHEASIGKISQEAIEYLMSRGLSEKEALSLIIKGFLDYSSLVLPIKEDLQLLNYIRSEKLR